MTVLRRFDIYKIPLDLGHNSYPRWVVVVSPQWFLDAAVNRPVLVVPLSASLDLFDQRRVFRIEAAHPEFAQTGLETTSYAVLDYLSPVAREEFQPRRRRGILGPSLTAGIRAELRAFLDLG